MQNEQTEPEGVHGAEAIDNQCILSNKIQAYFGLSSLKGKGISASSAPKPTQILLLNKASLSIASAHARGEVWQ